MKKQFLVILIMLFATSSIFAQLVVINDTNTIQLVNDFVLSGVSTSNVQYTGASNTLGTFSNGTSTNLGLSNGIIMTTGNLSSPEIGSPVSEFASTSNSSVGCSELDVIAGGITYDASILEFDLIPSGNILEFQYVFASEEYPEFINSGYNDVFGFFISGSNPSGGNYSNTNIAIIPSTTMPVAIDNVNAGTNSSYFVDNETLNGQSIVFDGFTTVLLAKIDVTPIMTYHLKMAIADVADGIYDSGIFLKAQSMKSYNSTTGINKVQSDSYKVYTNFASGQLIVNRLNINKGNDILSIYDSQGQIIKQLPLKEEKTELDISNLTKGVYIVKINCKNSPFVTKFIL
jgi:hypothetical protein